MISCKEYKIAKKYIEEELGKENINEINCLWAYKDKENISRYI